MATRSTSRSTNRNSNQGSKSAFSWGESAGPMIGAAIAGVAIGLAANMGRKFMLQGMEAMVGDWDQILAAEHGLTIGILDKMLATDSSQTWKRRMLLMQLTHAIDKHMHQEEMVVYPALRENNENVDADHLTEEHGYNKTFLYKLHNMGADSPAWLETARELRSLVIEHARMEEEQVFPRFKENMTEEQNARITSLMNKDGFRMA